jgi:uncharacterized protein
VGRARGAARLAVEGVKGTWRVDPSQLGQPFLARAALLSPFDRLMHDRKRTVELFDFDYQLEMYKPAAKRRWGYFALLRVHAILRDVPFAKTTTAAIGREINDLASWLRLDLALPG